FFMALILLFLVLRRGVIIPAILGIFSLGLIFYQGESGLIGRFIYSIQAVFNALMLSMNELLGIIIVISLMVGMLRAIEVQGAARIMVQPLRKVMRGPWSSFFVLGLSMYIASIFFWPTPAVALIGTMLIPVAIRAGLPAMGAAVAV